MKQLNALIDNDKNKASESEYQNAMSLAIELLVGLGILRSPQTDIKGFVEDIINKSEEDEIDLYTKSLNKKEIERDLKELQQQIDELNREEIEIQREIDLLEMRTKFK